MRIHHLLPALLLLASCSSEPSPDLVGTWRGPNGDFLTTMSFGADGTFSETASSNPGNTQTRTGTWRLEGSSLFLRTVVERGTETFGAEFESSSYLAGDTLVRGAFLPVGPHRGVVGTWRRREANADWDRSADTVGPQRVLEGTLTLREDGTTHMELRFGNDLRIVEGAYSVVAGAVSLRVSSQDDDTFQRFPLLLVDDAVLGSGAMTRQ